MTLQEIQYKAQAIIQKWRDEDSAPYVEFVEELASMDVPELPSDLEKADVSVDLDKAIQDWMLEIDGKYAILTHPPVDRVILETAKKFYDLGLNSKK